MHSLQISATAIPAAFSPCGSAAAAASAAAFLAAPGHLDPDDVAGALADEAGAVEDLAELVAEVGVGGAEDQGGRAGDGLAGVGRAAEAGDRPRPHPFADVLGGELALRGDQALGQQQDRGAPADPVGDRADRLRQRLGGDREADQVEAVELDLGGGPDVDRLRQRHAGQVAAVLAAPRPAPPTRSAVRAPSWTSRPPRASRTATAVPQLPAPITAARRIGGRPPRSSHCSCTLGQIRAVTVSASAGEGSSARGKVIALPSRTLTLRGRIRQPRRTCFGADHRGRDHRRAGLQRQAADAALRRRRACRCGSGCPRGRCRRCRRVRPPCRAVSIDSSSDSPRRIGKAPSRERSQPCQRRSNSSTLAT